MRTPVLATLWAGALAGLAQAQITSLASLQMNLNPVAPNSFTWFDGTPYDINAGGTLADSGFGTYAPVYTRPGTPTQWDTEQFVARAPFLERVVVEGRVGQRTTAGDYEFDLQQGRFTGTVPDPFVGNPQNSPSYATTVGPTGQFNITSGTAIPFVLRYTASSREMVFNYGGAFDAVTGAITGGTSIDQVVDALTTFNSIVLRVNVAAFGGSAGTTGTRSLQLDGLELTEGGAGPGGAGASATTNDLLWNFTGAPAGVINSTATGTGTTSSGQRSFADWGTGVVSDTASFTIVGNVTYAWTTPTAPNGSGLSWQFKLGEDLYLIPEPGVSAVLAGVLALLLAARRRSRS